MSVSAFPYGINTWLRLLFTAGGDFYAGDTTGTVTSGVRFNRDGTIDHVDSVNGNSEEASWWSGHPDTDIGDDYEVRPLSAGGSGSYDSAASADDAWVTMSTARDYTNSISSNGIEITTRTFEIRKVGTTAPVISRSFTSTAERVI